MNPRNIPPPVPNVPNEKQPRVQPDDPMSPDRKPPSPQHKGRQPEGRQQQGGNVSPSDKNSDKHHQKAVEPVDDADDDVERNRR